MNACSALRRDPRAAWLRALAVSGWAEAPPEPTFREPLRKRLDAARKPTEMRFTITQR